MGEEEEKMKLDDLLNMVTTIGLPSHLLTNWIQSGLKEDISAPVAKPTDEKGDVKVTNHTYESPQVKISVDEELRVAHGELSRVRKRCAEMERQHKERERELVGEQVAWRKLLTMAIKTLDEAQMVPPVSSQTDAEWETMSEPERLAAWLVDLTGAIERGGKWTK